MTSSALYGKWDLETRPQIDEGIPGAVRTVIVPREQWSTFERWVLEREKHKKIWYKVPEGKHSFKVAVINLACLG